jgi:hypothetical protein
MPGKGRAPARGASPRIFAMSVKSIFDGLYLDQLFQKNERGETVFYPHGLMGRGYLLPAEREDGVRNRMRLLMIVALVGGGSLGLLLLRIVNSAGTVQPVGWLIGGGLFALFIGALVPFQSRLAQGLTPVEGPRPSALEWLKAGRAARSRWTHWACLGLGAFSLLMAIAGFAFGYADGDQWAFASGGFMLLVGTALTWDGALGLVERSRTAQGT